MPKSFQADIEDPLIIDDWPHLEIEKAEDSSDGRK